MDKKAESILDGEPYDDITQEELQGVLIELTALNGLAKFFKDEGRQYKITKYIQEISKLLEPPPTKNPEKMGRRQKQQSTPKKIVFQTPKSPITRKTFKAHNKDQSVATEYSMTIEIPEDEQKVYQEYVEELLKDKELESCSEESKLKLILTCKRMKSECVKENNFEKASKLDNIISEFNKRTSVGCERRQARLNELMKLRENLENRIQEVKAQYEKDLTELKELHREAIESFNETLDQEKYELEEKSFSSSFANDAKDSEIEDGCLEKALIRMKDYDQLKLVRKENKIKRKHQREVIEELKQREHDMEIDKFNRQVIVKQKAFDDRWEEKYRKLEESAMLTADRLSAKLKAIDEQILFYEKKQL